MVKGPLIEALAPLIDGERSADQIAQALSGQFRPEEIYDALLELARHNLIYDAAVVRDDPQLALWHYLGGDLKQVQAGIDTVRINLACTPDLAGEPFIAALDAYGLMVAADGPLTVVFASDYRQPTLAENKARSLAGAGAVRPAGGDRVDAGLVVREPGVSLPPDRVSQRWTSPTTSAYLRSWR